MRRVGGLGLGWGRAVVLHTASSFAEAEPWRANARPQAVWTHVLAGHRSWVSGMWQEPPELPGAGGCAEVKGVPKTRRCFACLLLKATPVPPKGTLAAGLRAGLRAGPRGQQKRWRPARGRKTEPGDPLHQIPALEPLRKQAAVTRESRNVGTRSFFSLVQINPTAG